MAVFFQRTPEQFLQNHWQQHPLLIRGAFPQFQSPVDGDDLAGLACEQTVESRLITGSLGQTWSLEHGPLPAKRFETLPAQNWTLLVQDVEKHIPEVSDLLRPFSFLPRWRIDDVMVSYAAPGGSVGPHTDQYDVFLLQGQGSRRWQWSENFDPQLLENCDLKMLAQFAPEQQAVLQPGDMLYLPPGVAHYGVALDEGLTFSIGLRAPDKRQLMLELGQAVAQRTGAEQMMRDAGRTPSRHPTLLDAADRTKLRGMLRQGLHFSDSDLDMLLGSMLTRPKEHLPATEPEAMPPEQFLSRWASGDHLLRCSTSRFAHYESDGAIVLFANGNAHQISRETFQWLLPILDGPTYFTADAHCHPLSAVAEAVPCSAQAELAQTLLAEGCLVWASDGSQDDLSED